MNINSDSDTNLQFIVEDNSKAVFLYDGVPYRLKALADGIRWRRVSNYGLICTLTQFVIIFYL